MRSFQGGESPSCFSCLRAREPKALLLLRAHDARDPLFLLPVHTTHSLGHAMHPPYPVRSWTSQGLVVGAAELMGYADWALLRLLPPPDRPISTPWPPFDPGTFHILLLAPPAPLPILPTHQTGPTALDHIQAIDILYLLWSFRSLPPFVTLRCVPFPLLPRPRLAPLCRVWDHLPPVTGFGIYIMALPLPSSPEL